MTHPPVSIAQLGRRVAQFVADRHWESYHTPKSLSMSIAIEAAELMELFQWHGNEASRLAAQDAPWRARIADELADIMIYCLALANAVDLDLGQAVETKLAINNQRYPPGRLPSRHRRVEEQTHEAEGPAP